ncbi:hypothetical protein BDV41DRAFT_317574 [Aspergillus transmontanensis]|uniref:Uncharacterized protein n=1 Tax=Aspergillus transmontanensis TaxID=1034304 RepID=A0A5N6VT53_9EURO|nr:hypothetical protein BDV41DRAFT_317574 [Aspergillus transmontanensis]
MERSSEVSSNFTPFADYVVSRYSLSAGKVEIGDLFSVPCCEMDIGVGGIPGFSCTPILYVCMYVCMYVLRTLLTLLRLLLILTGDFLLG